MQAILAAITLIALLGIATILGNLLAWAINATDPIMPIIAIAVIAAVFIAKKATNH